MTQSQESLRILFADDDAETRQYFRELLPRLGHQTFAVSGGRELIHLAQQLGPDLIITDVLMPDLDGLRAVEEIGHNQSIPVILISGHPEDELLQQVATGHVMNYLVKPVREAGVQAAINMAMLRFRQSQALHQEANNLRLALESRKLLERAKGAVMKRLRVEEDEAFLRMKRFASHHNRKLAEVSEDVLAAEQVFHSLDQL